MGLATFDGPHLLILDEPTNHLDIDSRRALIDALNGFQGAVIVITQDRHLIEATAERLWLVANGTVSAYAGDMDDYRKLVVAAPARQDVTETGGDQRAQPSRADLRRAAAQRRDALKPLKKKISETEVLMADLEKRIQLIDGELADPGLYERAPARSAELSKERAQTADALAQAEETWLKLSSRYDTEIAE